VGKIAYRLDLPIELSQIHNIFHVSQLRKCVTDTTEVVPLGDIQVDERLGYVEKPVAIVERKTKTLQNVTIANFGQLKSIWSIKSQPRNLNKCNISLKFCCIMVNYNTTHHVQTSIIG